MRVHLRLTERTGERKEGRGWGWGLEANLHHLRCMGGGGGGCLAASGSHAAGVLGEGVGWGSARSSQAHGRVPCSGTRRGGAWQLLDPILGGGGGSPLRSSQAMLESHVLGRGEGGGVAIPFPGRLLSSLEVVRDTNPLGAPKAHQRYGSPGASGAAVMGVTGRCDDGRGEKADLWRVSLSRG